MAMRRVCLDLYDKGKVAKHFVVRSLLSGSLETDADKRVLFSTKPPVAEWERVLSLHRAEIK